MNSPITSLFPCKSSPTVKTQTSRADARILHAKTPSKANSISYRRLSTFSSPQPTSTLYDYRQLSSYGYRTPAQQEIKGVSQNRTGPRTPPYNITSDNKTPGTYRNYSYTTNNHRDASIQRNLFLLTLLKGSCKRQKRCCFLMKIGYFGYFGYYYLCVLVLPVPLPHSLFSKILSSSLLSLPFCRFQSFTFRD